MLASEAQLIASSILADVLRVGLGQALNGGIDGFHAALLPHAGSGEVGVSPSTCARAHTHRVRSYPAILSCSYVQGGDATYALS